MITSQFDLIYIAQNLSNCPLKALYVAIIKRKPNNHMTPYGQAFGDSEEEILPLNRKKPSTDMVL